MGALPSAKSTTTLILRRPGIYDQTIKSIEEAPWQRSVDPIEGVFLHEPQDTVALEDMATSDALPSQIAFGQKSP